MKKNDPMEADPDTRVKVQDIRKYAASITLQQDMLVGDLIEDFNWRTPAVFYKFYFMQTEVPGMPVSSLPGARTGRHGKRQPRDIDDKDTASSQRLLAVK